ncbi:MAG: FGGY-family carbohydrate kinase [Spirochaetia bacterium]|jgi:xylulokinase
MSEKYVLAFDLGTGGNKSVLFDSSGKLLGSGFSAYKTYYPQSGWAEQKPMDWWKSIVDSTRNLLSTTRIDKKQIAALSISGHGIGVVPMSAKGELLRESTLLWSDSRAIEQCQAYFQKVDHDEWYKTTGAALRPENYALFKIMWHRDHEKDLYNATHKFLGTKDFINFRMTGKMISDYSDASFSGINDLMKWQYSEELCRPSCIPLEKYPDLHPSTHIVGELLPEPAEELGIPPGVPIVCGGYDGSCTALGAGNFKEGRVYNYVGSSSWISVAARKPMIDLRTKPYCYYSAVPAMFNSTVSIYSAGGSFEWVKNILCREEILAGEIAGVDPYKIMEKEALLSPIGANGLIFNPSLMGGSTIHPSPHIKGALVGLGLQHTKADVLRSVMEGVALDLRLALQAFRNLGVPAKEIRMVGGGSKSDMWRQIFSDIYDARIILTNIGQEAAALGAAALAGVGTGIWPDFSIIDGIAQTIQVNEPDRENQKAYQNIIPNFSFIMERLLEIGERTAQEESK